MKSLKLSAAAALALTLALSAAADARESAVGDITIRRDSHGMPHVYAGTVADLFHGYGYAVAQDRLFQMEMARRSTQGTVAEVLGEKFVAFDKSIRGNFSPERIRAQIDGLPRAERDILEGYASGMNAWLREVREAPAKLLPKQFNDLGFQPADWTAYDVAMVFVGTMANRFSDANGEIDNLALLTALTDRHGADTAWQIFNQLKWSVDPKAATTVPAESGSYNFFGVPQGSPEEARAVAVTMNRGTENNMTVFAPQGVRAVDVVAPGQSGFVAPDGEVSPHARDQFDLYVNFGHKPVWFTPDEVRRDTRSTTRLHRSEKAKPSTNKGDKP